MQFTFPNKEALADWWEERAEDIRVRAHKATRNSQHVMRAEAHAYEQCAMMLRQSKFTGENQE